MVTKVKVNSLSLVSKALARGMHPILMFPRVDEDTGQILEVHVFLVANKVIN